MKKKIIFFSSLLLMFSTFLIAQSNIYFRHFSAQEGLSQNSVTCILQDQLGFMWLGTEDGLNRYNGYDVDVFKHDPSDNRTLSHSNIRCMMEDKEGVLWIGTDNGLNSFDRSTEKFIRYQNDPRNANSISSNLISGIVQDKNGLLWIGTNNGLNSFDSKNNLWTVYKHDDSNTSSLSKDNISCIAINETGILMTGTGGGGFNYFDVKNKKNSVYKNELDNDYSLSGNYVTTIYEDKSGAVWIGTINEGLNKFDKTSERFIHYKNNATDPNSISNNSVFSICEDVQGTLWVGTFGGGLNAFNRTTEKLLVYKNDPQNISSISDNNIWSIYSDHAGALWIGTKNGVNISDKGLRRFEIFLLNGESQNNNVYSICEDAQGTLWFGLLGGGLISIDKKSGQKKQYLNNPADANSLCSNNVFAVCDGGNNLIWIGTYNGLNSLDTKTGKFVCFKNVPADNSTLSNNYVRALLKEKSGELWIGTYGGGLNRFNSETEKFTHYKNDPGDASSISNDIITSLHQDSEGTIWAGTYGAGLAALDKSTNKFISFKNDPSNVSSISNNFIHCITEDKSGALCMGTYGGGLNIYNKSRKEFARYTERDGLPNNVINGIVPDVNGNLWLSTNKGICKFTPDNMTSGGRNNVRTYDAQDGAQNKYNEGAFLKTKNGKIFFGGTGGYNSFFYDEIKDNPYLPPVAITRFYLFEKPHSMDTMITSKRTVELSYKQNFFSFEFAGLNYTFPEKNQYAYMMEGLDKDWNYCNNRRYAAYTNIDPGEYTFRVKAANNDGIWNDQGTLLRITITPPFWKTWWFSIIAGLTVASSVVLYIRFRTRTLLKQNVLLENKVEQRTSELKDKNEELVKTMDDLKATQDQLIQSEKMASLGQLTAGIAHEIQNPLNFVNNFSGVSVELLEDLQHSSPQEKPDILDNLKTNLQKIKHHGQRAERIVKGMLMHSRTGRAEKQPTDINKLVEDSLNLAYTGMRAKDNTFKCQLKINTDATISTVNIVPQDISRVMLNIINNALYSMNERMNSNEKNYQPQLEVSTIKQSNAVVIKIKDNGRGIPDEIRDKIFQPFFTTKPTGEGTGLGLSLSYDIVAKGHHGEIKVNSVFNEGSEFIILLPT